MEEKGDIIWKIGEKVLILHCKRQKSFGTRAECTFDRRDGRVVDCGGLENR